jgi:hypothetical protein
MLGDRCDSPSPHTRRPRQLRAKRAKLRAPSRPLSSRHLRAGCACPPPCAIGRRETLRAHSAAAQREKAGPVAAACGDKQAGCWPEAVPIGPPRIVPAWPPDWFFAAAAQASASEPERRHPAGCRMVAPRVLRPISGPMHSPPVRPVHACFSGSHFATRLGTDQSCAPRQTAACVPGSRGSAPERPPNRNRPKRSADNAAGWKQPARCRNSDRRAACRGATHRPCRTSHKPEETAGPPRPAGCGATRTARPRDFHRSTLPLRSPR